MRQAIASIAVVDFGGQYTHLICRGIRRAGYRADVRSVGELAAGALAECAGMVLSGGPDSVLAFDLSAIAGRIRGFPRPVLGICYGHQLLARIFGGLVVTACAREYGLTTITAGTDAVLFRGLPPVQRVWMSHGDHVETVPHGFTVTASTDTVPVAAMESAEGLIYSVQFHPEVVHTEHGAAMLGNFIRACLDAAPAGMEELSWSADAVRDEILGAIRTQAGERPLLLLVSGGVDSLVCLGLCIEAVGSGRVHAVHIDTGFMRANESREVAEHLVELGYHNLHVVDASDRYFSSLKGVINPEEKRSIIGRLFVEVLRDAVEALGVGPDWMLVQGTIYPDRIETGGTERADRIKTHHNRVSQIQALIDQGRVIEPLADLYKHEVRHLGVLLGLPPHLVQRQPFPGPGLAVRVVCSDTAIPLSGFDREQASLSGLIGPDLDGLVLPVRSVGVQGDARTYCHPAMVWYRDRRSRPDWQVLKAVAARIVNALSTVNRVVWSARPAGHVSLGVCMLDRRRIDLLQEVDAAARDAAAGERGIWQMPVVALPLFDHEGNQAFVLRPVSSRDAMTADVFAMDPAVFEALRARLQAIEGVGPILYDLTTKPPGTIEWE
ncbi:glutamine-hydrolyzing GMP synthase [Candidatus Fermentibacteria bacterium]|nr:glutamine-hydrolyzing GMP synthase [Candidatus Fermentibacteria bacterium]